MIAELNSKSRDCDEMSQQIQERDEKLQQAQKAGGELLKDIEILREANNDLGKQLEAALTGKIGFQTAFMDGMQKFMSLYCEIAVEEEDGKAPS